jgi:hypothetical protein
MTRTTAQLLSLSVTTLLCLAACGDKGDDTGDDTGGTVDSDTDTDADTDTVEDADGDGHPAESDCDDTDPTVHPDADDVCDGIDQDCDGLIDGALSVPGAHASVQAAIDAAESGDTVCVSPGIWAGQVDFSGKDLEVHGWAGPAETTLDGEGTGPVVRFENGETRDATLSGFTVTGGTATSGAGVRIDGSGATLRGLVVAGNGCSGTSCRAPGIAVEGGTALIEDVVVEDNTVDMTDSEGNTMGGGLGGGYAQLDLVDVVVRGNTLRSAGGAFAGGLLLLQSEVTATNLQVTANEIIADGNGWGGGIGLEGGSLDAAEVTVSDNTVTSLNAYGAGVYANSGELWLVDGTVSGNHGVGTLEAHGGGAYGVGSAIGALGLTIEDNTCVAAESAFGAGIRATINDESAGGVLLDDVLIAGNTSESDDDAFGALSVNEVPMEATWVTVQDNTTHGADNWGAGWHEHGSDGGRSHIRIIGNVATGASVDVAGMRLAGDSAPEFHNLIVAGNRTESEGGAGGGGVLIDRSSAAILNNATITGNHASGTQVLGVGVQVTTVNVATLRNVSITGNTGEGDWVAAGGLGLYPNAQVDVSHGNIHGNTGGDVMGLEDPAGSNGNISQPAEYADTTADDPADWDLQLTTGSALIDAGDPDVFDPDGTRSDIGAHGGPLAADW